ncbi:MAG: isoprenylcysteine carboxylmethyltransferase family protein [Candidatus Sericytochromatia bacterium]|nr:isoprenylcysteine carboxylmethyltransferase family protein [Candidatus Sericytochromatia bacterium]
MSHAALELVLLNYAFIASLPALFFRRTGRLRAAWWLTGLHFGGVPACLLLAAAGWLPGTWTPPAAWQPGLTGLAVAASAASLVVLAMARGCQRVRLAQWHMESDAPAEIVTWGPYAWVRHPFYLGYLLAAGAAALLAPGPIMAGWVGYTWAVLARTARREERRLLASALGAEYAPYMARTGRFLPGWRRGREP